MLPDNFYCSPEYYDDEPEEDIGLFMKLAQIDCVYESLMGGGERMRIKVIKFLIKILLSGYHLRRNRIKKEKGES